MSARPLREIARDIVAAWETPWPPSVTNYFKLFEQANDVDDVVDIGVLKVSPRDAARDAFQVPMRLVVRWFLGDARYRWRGRVARRLKAELRELLKAPRPLLPQEARPA